MIRLGQGYVTPSYRNRKPKPKPAPVKVEPVKPVLTVSQQAMAVALGARLRALRNAAGLTQAEVSRRSGIDRPNVARLENGVHVPSVDSVMRYARAIGVKPSEVFSVLDEVAGD